MNKSIVELIEEAKGTEHGLCWFSEKGPINISKEGIMTPAFTDELPQWSGTPKKEDPDV